MGKPRVRFVVKAVDGSGWQVWDRVQKKWWGNPFCEYPRDLLAELNGLKRPDKLVELYRRSS